MKHYKLDLPTGVQTFFLLKAATLAPDLEKLVRTTATLVYGDMKEKNNVVKTVVVCQLKKKSFTIQIKKAITRKPAVTRKGIILGNPGLNRVDLDGNIMRCHNEIQQNMLHQIVLIERLKKQI